MDSKEKQVKILFIRLWQSSFIQNDLDILQKKFKVKVVDFSLNKKDPVKTFKTLFNMITGIIWADIAFSWFAGDHSFLSVKLSKLFKKKSVVVIGGLEVAKIRELNYGFLNNPKTARKTKYVFENSNVIIALTEILKNEAMENYGVDGNNFEIIPTGFDYDTFQSNGEKEDMVLTVGLVQKYERIKLKGIDTFVKAAELLPDTRFVVNGVTGEALEKIKKNAPSNVEFVGPLSFEELLALYQKSKVYCQLSMREGLPTAVCEAMLCECVPVGTNRYGIPVAIGDTGFYTEYGDVQLTAEAIKKALLSSNGKKARERIKTRFNKERKEENLTNLIERLTQTI
jgi:glycosyltransferase involved in cell wall biosynthesis